MSSLPKQHSFQNEKIILNKLPREKDLKVTTIILNPSEKKSIKEMVKYLNPSNNILTSNSRNSYSVETNNSRNEISKSFSLLPSSNDLDSSSDSGYRNNHLSEKALSAFSGSPSRINNDYFVPQKNQQRILNISEEEKRKIREKMVKDKIREINRKKEEKNRKKNQFMEVKKENQYYYQDNRFEPIRDNRINSNNNNRYQFSYNSNNNINYNYSYNNNNYNYHNLTPQEKEKREQRILKEKMEKKKMIKEYNRKMRENNLKKCFSIIKEVDNEDKTSSSDNEEINNNNKEKSGRKEKKEKRMFDRYNNNKEETTEGFTV